MQNRELVKYVCLSVSPLGCCWLLAGETYGGLYGILGQLLENLDFFRRLYGE